MKKRKKFLDILFPRIVIAWIIAIILGFIFIKVVFKSLSFDSFIARNENVSYFLYRDLSKKENTEEIIGNNKVSNWYLCSFPGNYLDVNVSHFDFLSFVNLKKYAYIYDLETDEIIMDSSQQIFLSGTFLQEKQEGTASQIIFLSCDPDLVKNIEPFDEIFDTLECQKWTLKEWFGNKPHIDYQIMVEEILYDSDEGNFIPIKGYLKKSTKANILNAYGFGFGKYIRKYNQTESIPFDLSSNFEGYEEKYQSYVFENSSVASVFGTTESDKEYFDSFFKDNTIWSPNAMKEHIGISYVNADAFSNEARICALYRALPEKFGNKEIRYIVVQDNVFETYKSLWLFVWLCFIMGSSVIAIVISHMHYNKLKNFYRNEDYRIALLNSLVHDLRTPLTVMSGYAENLKENIQNESKDEYADGILQNTGYVNNIIEDVIELSHTEQSTEKIKKEKADLVVLFNESEDGFKTIIEKKGIKTEFKNSYIRRVDVKSMKRVCDNLIGNAVKYTPNGGSIKIYACDKPFCHYLVIENSPITPIKSNPKKLWEPFMKDDESRSDVSGNGLGLAISKNILEKNRLKAKIMVKEKSFIVRIK